MKPLKILLASSSSGSRGGGELFLLTLAQGLLKEGHTPILWCSESGSMDELTDKFLNFGEVVRSPYTNTYTRKLRSFSHLYSNSDCIQIASDWNAISPDIVHLNKQTLEDGLDLLNLPRVLEIPSCSTIHITQTEHELGAFLGLLRDQVAHQALHKYNGQLIAIEDSRTEALNAFIGKQAINIRNGVRIPQEVTCNDSRNDNASLQILCVGRMVAQKRPLLFLDIAHKLIRQHPQLTLQFTWVGDGDLSEAWDRKVKDLQLNGSISRIQWTDDVTPYYQKANLLLHTAKYEGLPLSILEAMSFGLGVLMPQDLVKELPALTSKPVGWLPIDVATPTLPSLEHIQSIGTQARDRVINEFSQERMTREYIDVYRSLLNSNNTNLPTRPF